MKYRLTFLFALLAYTGWSQQDSIRKNNWHSYYERRSTTITFAVGFIDNYRRDYTVPAGFRKNNTSGFAPICAKVEYGWRDHISIAAIFSYDAFIYNFSQQYIGNNGPFTRYRTNTTRIFSGGIAAFYHLDRLISVNRLDPFISIGLSLNNIRYSAYPQGDSTLIKLDHTVTPYIKAGARYYISDRFSLYADAGYEKQCIVSLGCSCRFHPKK